MADGQGAGKLPPPDGRLILSHDDLAPEETAPPVRPEPPTERLAQTHATAAMPPVSAASPSQVMPAAPRAAAPVAAPASPPPGPQTGEYEVLTRYSSGIIGFFGSFFIWLMSMAVIIYALDHAIENQLELDTGVLIAFGSLMALGCFVSLFMRSFKLDLTLIAGAGWMASLGGSSAVLDSDGWGLPILLAGSIILLIGTCRGVLRPLRSDDPGPSNPIAKSILMLGILGMVVWFSSDLLFDSDIYGSGWLTDTNFFTPSHELMNLVGLFLSVSLMAGLTVTFRNSRITVEAVLIWASAWLIPLFSVSIIGVLDVFDDLSFLEGGGKRMMFLYLASALLIFAGSVALLQVVTERFKDAAFEHYGFAQQMTRIQPVVAHGFQPGHNMPVQAQAPPGWQSDPHNPDQYRWWDGHRWTDQYAPKPGAPGR